jgi:L-lactate dehydrogenase complex protein LldG
MSAKTKILSRIKRGMAPSVELPDLSIADTWGGEVNFDILKQTIETVGGEMHVVDTILDIDTKLNKMFQNSKMTYSNVEDLNFGNVELTDDFTAHDLAKLKVAVLKGQFAVEENGSIFISDESMGNRMIPTITEYLVLVIPKSEVVKNMHEAYKKIDLRSFEYGTFISGPSKTADIESTLVFGAHGAKNLTVFLV